MNKSHTLPAHHNGGHGHNHSHNHSHSHGGHPRHSLLRQGSRHQDNTPLSEEQIKQIQAKFVKNFFGLPPYALQQTPDALAYQCRKPLDDDFLDQVDDTQYNSQQDGEANENTLFEASDSTEGLHVVTNFTAQRKVASALLTMVSNQVMLKHFLHGDGFKAILRLISDTRDYEVLVNCGNCLMHVSKLEIIIYCCNIILIKISIVTIDCVCGGILESINR